jgi:Sel1 repeat
MTSHKKHAVLPTIGFWSLWRLPHIRDIKLYRKILGFVMAIFLAACGTHAQSASLIEGLKSGMFRIAMLNAKGVIVESNFVSLPTRPLEDLSEEEMVCIVNDENAKRFLSQVGNVSRRNDSSLFFENQLNHLWHNEASIKTKVINRLKTIFVLNDYNKNLTTFNSLIASADAKYTIALEYNNKAQDFLARANKRATEDQLVSSFLMQGFRQMTQEANNYEAQGDIFISRATKCVQLLDENEAFLNKIGVFLPADRPRVEYKDISCNHSQYVPPLSLEVDNQVIPKSSTTVVHTNSIALTDDENLDKLVVKKMIEYADSGIDAVQYALAIRYLEGKGVPKDTAKGVEYLKKSAAQGNEKAQSELRRLLIPA